ncbi:hypothetical protein Hbl1158_13915 [Halobaculum sp. CBA1158]|uniref:hypothetical protein n=1 Tax=Halobaculum sp. CBA1158 TaxID=2904243 RepID=UPI001F268F6B|nr:hypothetical protein [Halobaculum sp. CBA1158]UIO99604.1 hypothetical protein Hbl1158_13915 [Halobaculum sp. CBA1158]
MTDAEGSRVADDRAGVTDAEGGYRGLFGAFPYAFRASGSLTFKSFVVFGGLAAALLGVLFLLALVTLFGATAQARFSVVRAFYVVVALGAVVPIVSPVLLVARSHRRGIARRPGYDAGLAIAGYLFILSLYVGMVAALPETFVLDGETTARPTPAGAFAPAVELLYALPRIAGLVIPAVVACAVPAVHRLRR